MPNTYFIGVDLGTGSAKATAFSQSLEVLKSYSKAYPLNSSQPGYFEQEAELIWQAMLECVQKILLYCGSGVLGIGLSSAMHSLLVVDVMGNPLIPVITWADLRSESEATTLKLSPQKDILYQTTGTPIHSMSPLTKIIWLGKHRPELFLYGNRFISIKSFIWYKLFGVFEEDWSLASATGLFDIVNHKWFEFALKLANISKEQLPEPVPTGHFKTHPNREVLNYMGLLESVPWVIGASDGCLAHLGSSILQAGTASLTIGTSAAIRISSTFPVYDNERMIFNYILDEQNFIIGGALNNGGNVLDWGLRNFSNREIFLEKKDENRMEAYFKEIVKIPDGSNGLLFLPYLSGERSPIWDEKASGVFLGIKISHNSGHFMRSIVEGICFAIHDVHESLENCGLKINQIHISGGFTVSPIWVQILANILGKNLVIPLRADASSFGATLMAMKALGYISSYEEVQNLSIQNSFVTNFEIHKFYQIGYRIYKKAYQDLKMSLHEIHDWK